MKMKLPKVPQFRIPTIEEMFLQTPAGQAAVAEIERAKEARRKAIVKDIAALRRTHERRGKEHAEAVRVAKQEYEAAQAEFKAKSLHYRELANSGELHRLETLISRLETQLVNEGLVPSWIDAAIAELEAGVEELQGAHTTSTRESIGNRLTALRNGINRLKAERFAPDQPLARKIADEVRASIPQLEPRPSE